MGELIDMRAFFEIERECRAVKIKVWSSDMSDKETADLGYWERNVLALHFAEGWYNDDVPIACRSCDSELAAFECVCGANPTAPRYQGWRRILSLRGKFGPGAITFHIPDDFDVGNLPEIKPNWDGHTTAEKWQRILTKLGVEVDP